MSVKFSPIFNSQIVDSNGNPATGWKIYSYVANSSTPLATYTTSAGSVSQSNPIVINSLGFPTNGQIWLTAGLSYKLVLTNTSDVVQKTEDNIMGVNDSSVTIDQWVDSGLTPTYVSATSFTLSGDQTSAFTVGRRLRTTNTSGTIYSTISASVFGALTTITVINDSGVLDSGLSTVSYGLLTSVNQSIPSPVNEYQGGDVASASTINLDTVSGKIVDVTGTTPITAITLAQGRERIVRFRGILTLTNGASLPLPGGQNIITADGDLAIFRGEASSVVRCNTYILSGGRLLVVNNEVQTINASVAASALTITASRLSLDFRSATLTSGTVTTIVGIPANLVISSGSTLGTTNAIQSDIAVLALNNAGTIELAAANMTGGVQIDEVGVISTTAEGGAGAADSATVVYSTTARSNLAYRVLGIIRSTQATAGTWATAPSLIQGSGGNALTAMNSLGYGQTWQGVTRNGSTTYYNTTGKAIFLFMVSGNANITVTIGGLALQVFGVGAAAPTFPSSFIIPPGVSYSYTTSGATPAVYELR